MTGSVLVIGVGNPLRGDDAAGLEVVGRLTDLAGRDGIEVLAHEGEGMALLDLWAGAGAVVLVDSVRAGDGAGALIRVDASSSPVDLVLGATSSHALGVAEAIELARVIGMLPGTVVVYGVEGDSYEAGNRLSEAVASALERAAHAVRHEALELLTVLADDGID